MCKLCKPCVFGLMEVKTWSCIAKTQVVQARRLVLHVRKTDQEGQNGVLFD